MKSMLSTTAIVKKSSTGLQLAIDKANSCSSCTMKKKCSQNINLDNSRFIIPENLQENDKLILSISTRLFFSYISLVYVLPLLIFVSTIWICSCYNLSEIKIMSICLLNLSVFFVGIKYTKILNKFNSSFKTKKYC